MRQSSSERELIGRMQAGDTTAVAELSSVYGQRIQQLAFRYVKNWEDAEEVAQDVLWKVFRKIGAFREDAALSSWIYRITFNPAMSRLRTGRAARAADRQKGDVNSSADEGNRQPAEIGPTGVTRVLRPSLTRQEQTRLDNAAALNP